MVDSNAYESKVPRFDGALDENYQLWGLRTQTALESQQMAAALTNDEVNEKKDRRAR